MALEDAALRLKGWAARKGILTYEPPEELDEFAVEDITDAAEVAAADAETAEAILQKRKINYIGVDDDQNKIIVCTHQKLSKKDLEGLPATAEDGFEIEYIKGHLPAVKTPKPGVTSHGPFNLHNELYTCGSSVYPGNNIGAGTLGCLVQDQRGDIFGLSNNHVTGGCSYSDPDLPIVAPGPLDVMAGGGKDPFTIGHHSKVLPLLTGTPENVDINENLDAAIFKISDAANVSSMQRTKFDTPAAVDRIRTNIEVVKVGRTTELTRGRVIARSVGSERVQYNVPQYKFSSVVFFSNIYTVRGIGGVFADSGDSGSLIITRPADNEPKAVGLVFAVSPDKTLCHVAPLHDVMQRFGVTIVSDHNV